LRVLGDEKVRKGKFLKVHSLYLYETESQYLYYTLTASGYLLSVVVASKSVLSDLTRCDGKVVEKHQMRSFSVGRVEGTVFSNV